MSGLAAMLSTAAGVPAAPAGAGVDFLAALSTALGAPHPLVSRAGHPVEADTLTAVAVAPVPGAPVADTPTVQLAQPATDAPAAMPQRSAGRSAVPAVANVLAVVAPPATAIPIGVAPPPAARVTASPSAASPSTASPSTASPSAASPSTSSPTPAGVPPTVDLVATKVAARPATTRRSVSTQAVEDELAGSTPSTADRPLPGHRVDTGQQPSPAPGTVHVAAEATPAGLGMVGTDRVAKVREQVATRPMQRLSIELDDTRVAIRVRGDKVSVDVTSDPKGALGEGWARQVERTIDRAVRAQDTDSRGTNPERQPGSQGRRQQSGQSQPRRRPGQARQFEIGAWDFAPTEEAP